MTESAFRASAELAAALREFAEADRAFREEHIETFDRENPGHELLWVRRALVPGPRAVGFRDGTPDVPEGLSRARSREELIPKNPKRSKAGQAWQDVLDRMDERPALGEVFRRFGVPETASGGRAPSGGLYVSATQWADTGESGVIVFSGGTLGEGMFAGGGIGEHLTPIPLSEFHAIRERIEAEEVADQPA